VEAELTTLREPTFVRDYPADVRPLARQHRDDPRLAEAWDLIVGGVELPPTYPSWSTGSEAASPPHRAVARAAGGDHEAMQLDEDFLRGSSTRPADGRHGPGGRPARHAADRT